MMKKKLLLEWKDGEKWVACIVPARALAMITGASDQRFKKPQGPAEMKMTTVVEGWDNATYGSLGSRSLTMMERVHLCRACI